MELIEVAFEGEFVCCPDSFETFDKLSAASVDIVSELLSSKRGVTLPITLGVLEPPLSNAREFCLEPTGYHIDRDTSIGIVVYACDLLGCDCGVPWTW